MFETTNQIKSYKMKLSQKKHDLMDNDHIFPFKSQFCGFPHVD